MFYLKIFSKYIQLYDAIIYKIINLLYIYLINVYIQIYLYMHIHIIGKCSNKILTLQIT